MTSGDGIPFAAAAAVAGDIVPVTLAIPAPALVIVAVVAMAVVGATAGTVIGDAREFVDVGVGVEYGDGNERAH
jgi:hypothetical protein